MKTIEATATAPGTPTAVWALLADASAWPRWGPWTAVEVEGGGEQRLGAVRVLHGRRVRVRERITVWEPDDRFGYELLDGLKVHGYRAAVTLDPRPDGGTVVTWRSTYEKAAPITAVVLRLAIPDACRRLARAATA